MNSLTALLEPLVGQTLILDGQPGTVIEIMESPPGLVLRAENAGAAFQVDSLGRPQTLTTPTWTQSLFSESGHVLHPDLQRQIEPSRARAINEYLNTL